MRLHLHKWNPWIPALPKHSPSVDSPYYGAIAEQRVCPRCLEMQWRWRFE